MATRVLLVDDDEELLRSMQEALETEHFAVETARTVKSATVLLDSHAFDIVVTDLALEGTGGLAFCEQLAKARPALPVVVLSGHGEARTAALRLGAREMLVKPVRPDVLVKSIRKFTGGG